MSFCILIAGSLWITNAPESNTYLNINTLTSAMIQRSGTTLIFGYGALTTANVQLPDSLRNKTVPEIFTACAESAHSE